MRTGDEIEVKERLSTSADLIKVREALGGKPKHVEHQENYFFDGKAGNLASKRSSVRLRFIDGERCLVTVKESSVLSGGVNVAKETEEFVDFSSAKKTTERGFESTVFTVSHVAADALRRSGVTEADLCCIGMFKTTREAFDFDKEDDPHTLELDISDFGFAVAWEIEIETIKPKATALRAKLEKFLDHLGVSHRSSKKTKLACLVTKSID